MTSQMKTAPLDAELADRLLDLLSTDDAYRTRFQHDPRGALAEIGYVAPTRARMTACGSLPVASPEALVDCKVEELAPKEAIAAARAEIRAMLLQGLTQQTPKLDTGLEKGVRALKR
jgi:putative modified peptide